MTPESLKTRFFRYGINLYPMFFGTGGKVLFIAGDWKKVVVRLSLNMWTRNYVGTIFGGSQFSATDPMYMVMLINILGDEYVVWDKSASIQFKKPGKGKLKAEFIYTDDELELIKRVTASEGKYEFTKSVSWFDESGAIVSTIDKNIYVATKTFYKARRDRREKADNN
ncbi:MAG: DUF4442 domain-containing protein [Bdellovibrionales bacterium]|nr:DUF4442 domain-containing protein [Bdellovibrionales bacterium]